MRMHGNAEKYADVVNSIVSGPRTNKELTELTGFHEQTLAGFMHSLRIRGVVECRNGTRLAGQVGKVPFQWVWKGKQ